MERSLAPVQGFNELLLSLVLSSLNRLVTFGFWIVFFLFCYALIVQPSL
jgi:hypothetical protein